MIRLAEITEENWFEVANLSVNEDQKKFLAPPIGIIARGYVYRDCGAKVYVIENDGVPVGVALVREFADEPLGYDLQQFMIDERYQRRGYGTAGIRLLCRAAGENGISALYDELAADNPSLALFLKNGFAIESRRGGAVTVKRVL